MVNTQQMYNPPEDDYLILKEILIERTHDLNFILDRLKSGSERNTVSHFLIIGPRGMGKTHFLMLIYYELKGQEELNNKYISIKFAEEEYSIDSLSYFFIRILEELINELDSNEEKEKIKNFLNSNKELDNNDLTKKIHNFLESFYKEHKKKIVLCADNLDGIFYNISFFEKTGLKYLRSILQTKDYLVIIGSAPTFFKEIRNHDEPFYNFFEILHLSPLSQDGIENFVKKMAKIENNNDIIENFNEYIPRIKTIVHFTSGIPRLVKMLYYVIVNKEIVEVTDSLNKLLDELTPYYQARMATLSPQQQKIIDTIAIGSGPITPTEIAYIGRINRAIINAQLKKLSDLGFVYLAKQKKRKWKRYDITERMFRIWREKRKSKHFNRIKYLTDFLKAFYTTSDFKCHFEKIDEKFLKCIKDKTNYEALKYIKEYELIKDIIPKRIIPDFECRLIEKYIIIDDLKRADDEFRYLKNLKNKIKMPKKIDERLIELELKKIERQLEKAPKDILNKLKKSKILIEKKKFDGAIKELNEILKINPKNEDALYNRAIALGNLSKFEEAIIELDKVLKLNPKNENALYFKAIALRDLNKYKEAIVEFDKVLKLNPKYEDALCNKAGAFFDLKKYDEAIKGFDKVLKLNPKNEDALCNKAGAFFDLKKYDEAIKGFDKLLKINPKHENALCDKAGAFFDLKKYDEAIKGFNKLLKINPKHEDALYFKAGAFFNLKKYDEAIKEFDKLLKINPKHEDALYYKAEAFLTLKKYDKAIKGFDKLLKINPKHENALCDKAGAFFDLKKYDEAIKGFDKLLKLNLKHENALYFKAIAFLNFKKYDEAIKGFDKLLKLNPKHEDALLGKVHINLNLGKYIDNINYLKTFLKDSPNNENVIEYMGICYLFINNIESFLKWFNQIPHSKRKFDKIFKDWKFEYDFEQENACKFLKKTISLKKDSNDFLIFWEDLSNFTLKQIFYFSIEEFKNKNYGNSHQRLSLFLNNSELFNEKIIYDFILKYLLEIINIDLYHGEETFNFLKENLNENFKETFITLDKTIEYLKVKNEELLEKMFPEEREIVEELLREIKRKDIK